MEWIKIGDLIVHLKKVNAIFKKTKNDTPSIQICFDSGDHIIWNFENEKERDKAFDEIIVSLQK